MEFRPVEGYSGLLWAKSTRRNAEGLVLGTAKIEVIKRGTRGRVRRRLTIEGITKGDAEKRLQDERRRIEGDAPQLPETVEEFVERYGEECLKRVRAGTRRTYGSAIRQHIVPHFGRTRLAVFSGPEAEFEIERFGHVLREKKKRKFLRGAGVVEGATTLSIPTINGVNRVLRLLLNHARKRGFIASVPPQLSKPLKEPRRDHTARIAELRAFFATFDDEAAFRTSYAAKLGMKPTSAQERALLGLYYERHRWLKPFFIFLAETGWRRGDAIRVQWSDIDFQEGVATIRMAKTDEDAKAGLTPVLREALLELKRRAVVSPTHVFLGWNGRPLSPTTVRRAFVLGMKFAGVQRRLKVHSLRHAVGYRLAAAGTPLYLIQRQLGHASAKTTEIYLKAAGDHIGIATSALVATSWVGNEK